MPISSRWTVDIPNISIPSFLLASPIEPLSSEQIFLDTKNPRTNYLTLSAYRLWSQRLAAGLRRAGLQDGDRVLLFSDNSIFFPVVFMGVVMAGGIFTGANPTYVVRELAYQIKDSEALFILCAASCLDTGLEAATQAGLPTSQVFLFEDITETGALDEYPLNCNCKHWSNLLASEAEGLQFKWKDLTMSNQCHATIALNYSSGTTGFPKGVEISHYNLVANTLQMEHSSNLSVDSWPPKGLDRWLCFLPLYHAMAQTTFIADAVRRRIPVYIMPKFTYPGMLGYIQDFKITRLVVVPPILVKMTKDPRIKRGDWDLSSVKSITVGAAPLGRDIADLVERRLVKEGGVYGGPKLILTQAYGMTELTCGATMTVPPHASLLSSTNNHLPINSSSLANPANPADSFLTADSFPVGELLANCSAKIMNDDYSAEVPRDHQGELWVRGPAVMKGYWRNAVATKAIITDDGWLMTGDICTVNENNKFCIVDRKKELIKVRATQVAPAELESLLLTHPSVLDAAVIGTLIAGQEHPRAFIVPHPNQLKSPVAAEEIIEFMKQHTTRVKWITGGVRFVETLPRNPSGKILRRVVREWDRGGKDGGQDGRAKL